MIATCAKCNCSYSAFWGSHYCMPELPVLPKEFAEDTIRKGEKVPKRDYYDRKAWLEFVTGRADGDWKARASAWREAAEIRAQEALAHTTLQQATA